VFDAFFGAHALLVFENVTPLFVNLHPLHREVAEVFVVPRFAGFPAFPKEIQKGRTAYASHTSGSVYGSPFGKRHDGEGALLLSKAMGWHGWKLLTYCMTQIQYCNYFLSYIMSAKMGRPPGDPANRRKTIAQARLSDAEQKRVDAAASKAGLKVSAWMRKIILENAPPLD
jgi:hypothetical protein